MHISYLYRTNEHVCKMFCPRRLRLMLRNEQVLAALRAGVTWQLKLWRSTPPVATDYTYPPVSSTGNPL